MDPQEIEFLLKTSQRLADCMKKQLLTLGFSFDGIVNAVSNWRVSYDEPGRGQTSVP